jgi:hypothetical protein
VGRREFRRDVRLALLLVLVLFILLLLLLLLVLLLVLLLLVLLFLGLQHALEDLLELAERIGSCVFATGRLARCDRRKGGGRVVGYVDLRTPGMMDEALLRISRRVSG